MPASRGRAGAVAGAARGRLRQDRLRVFAHARRTPADLPARLGAEPLAGRVGERASELRVLDLRERAAKLPMLVERVLVRLAERGPEKARLLRLVPRHVVIAIRADEALDDLQDVRLPLVGRRRAGHVARLEVAVGCRLLQIGRHAVALEEGNEIRLVAGADQPGDVPAAVLGVADVRRPARRLGRVTAGLPIQRRAAHHPRHQVDLGRRRHRRMYRARNVLAFPGAVAMEQRGEDRDRVLLAGDVIRVPHLRRDRRQIVAVAGIGVVAAVHHHAAEREMDEVGGLVALPRSAVAERRHPRDDERREVARELLASEAERVVQAAAGGVEQDVGAAKQAEQALASGGAVQVERDRAFRAVVVPEVQRSFRIRPVAVEGTDATRRTAAGRLDLHNVRAETGEEQPTVLADLVADLDHPRAGEHARRRGAGELPGGFGHFTGSLWHWAPRVGRAVGSGRTARPRLRTLAREASGDRMSVAGNRLQADTIVASRSRASSCRGATTAVGRSEEEG